MSKVLEATCVGGVVTADGVPVPAAEIMSEGVGASEGILILDEDKAKYIAKVTPDLKTTLEQIIAALDQAVSAFSSAVAALTTLDGKPIGTLPSSPSATADIAQISAASGQISAAKAQLEALKGMLR